MGTVTLICGKLCSGKTTLAKKLQEENKAVLLSCDELMLKLFPQGAGDKHDEIAGRVKAYLYCKALEITAAGVDVILDWGFWSRRERRYATDFFQNNDIEVKWYYIDIDETTHLQRIRQRNADIIAGKSEDYFVDEGLFAKFSLLFDEPTAEEKAELQKN